MFARSGELDESMATTMWNESEQGAKRIGTTEECFGDSSLPNVHVLRSSVHYEVASSQRPGECVHRGLPLLPERLLAHQRHRGTWGAEHRHPLGAGGADHCCDGDQIPELLVQ